MNRPRLLGVDQNGATYLIDRQPPREYLLNFLGRQKAEKMYIDRDGKSVHDGYKIGSLWITIYRVEDWK